MKLYSYYRSSCSWRVRIVLELKQQPYDYIPINLLKDEQHSADYLSLNPNGMVPLLILDSGQQISQSVAIMEYLEETISVNPLYPKDDPYIKAIVRQAVLMIAADCQPLQNLHVIRAFGESGPEWARQVIERALTAFQKDIVERHGGLFSVGNEISMADVVLVPQLYNARRFKVDLGQFARLVEIEERLLRVEAFQRAAPERQPDYPTM